MICAQRYDFCSENPSIFFPFVLSMKKTSYICDMHTTLFPDFFTLDDRDCVHRKEIVLEKLQDIPIEFLESHAQRGVVLRRLSANGIRSLADLLRLPRFEVKEWSGVGQSFLHVFDEMCKEVREQPEHIIERWSLSCAAWTFPLDDNLNSPWKLTTYLELDAFCPSVNKEAVKDELAFRVMLVERVFAQIILLLKHRQPHRAAVLHRYFLQGLSAEIIAKVLHYSSSAVVMRIIEHEVLRPLLGGEPVAGVQLRKDFLEEMAQLRADLLFRPTTVLDSLTLMSIPRFLLLLSLTPMLHTMAESAWSCDFIVPRGEVMRARELLHDTLRVMQQHPTAVAEQQLAKEVGIAKDDCLFDGLLAHHPWIEQTASGYRLMTAHLSFDFCRVGRILLDIQKPLSRMEILMRYEQIYLERPPVLQMREVQRHFPAVISPQHGFWQWQTSPLVLPSEEISKIPDHEPTLFDGLW